MYYSVASWSTSARWWGSKTLKHTTGVLYVWYRPKLHSGPYCMILGRNSWHFTSISRECFYAWRRFSPPPPWMFKIVSWKFCRKLHFNIYKPLAIFWRILLIYRDRKDLGHQGCACILHKSNMPEDWKEFLFMGSHRNTDTMYYTFQKTVENALLLTMHLPNSSLFLSRHVAVIDECWL